MKGYGKELILDLHNCDVIKFTRRSLRGYFKLLCKKIDMMPHRLCWWDDVGVPEGERQTDPKTKGTSAVQFIMESNVTVHTLDLLGKVFVNIFSCKDFDVKVAAKFTKRWFGGRVVSSHVIERK